MGKVQRNKSATNCRVCGATTNNGKHWCSLHHPRKGTSAHRDRYSGAGESSTVKRAS